MSPQWVVVALSVGITDLSLGYEIAQNVQLENYIVLQSTSMNCTTLSVSAMYSCSVHQLCTVSIVQLQLDALQWTSAPLRACSGCT